MQETRDRSVTSDRDVKTDHQHRPSHLEILLVPKTLLQRLTNSLGTVERGIRQSRRFSMNLEVQAVDYLERLFSGMPRRIRGPRGQNLKHTPKD
jgi:hypothetical protein